MNKNNVTGFSRSEKQVSRGLSLSGENLREGGCFQYLKVDMALKRMMETEVSHRVGKAAKVLGALRNAWKKRLQSERMKISI